jgi:8-oxo-dGTP pyrophosphatase MutT (NUDIX family)
MSKAAAKKRRTAPIQSHGQAPHLQVGALCWRRSRKGLRIVLITSRDTGRWVIPKGWTMRHRTDAEAAAREAWEEAGLRGEISSRSIGIYIYLKGLGPDARLPCVVRVFPLKVQEMVRKYPEIGQRRIKWFDLDKAARKVAEPELAAMIRGFEPEEAAEPAEVEEIADPTELSEG